MDPSEFIARYPTMQSELRSFFSDVRVFGWERLHSDSSNQPTEVFDRATRTQAPSDPTVGSQWSFSGLKDQEYPVAFGNYELLSEIDRGGMGIVFRALHKPLERLVALKVIRAGSLRATQSFSVSAWKQKWLPS